MYALGGAIATTGLVISFAAACAQSWDHHLDKVAIEAGAFFVCMLMLVWNVAKIVESLK